MNKNVYFKTWVEQNLSRKEEIAAIQAYKALGFSNRAIAAKMNRSPKVINNLIKLGNSYGKNRITGAKPKIDCRTKRQIFKRAVVKYQTGITNYGRFTTSSYCTTCKTNSSKQHKHRMAK